MDDNGKLFFGLLAGIGIGTVLGILIAPDKGSNTLKKVEDALKEAADELLEYGSSALDEATDKVQQDD